MGALLRAVRFRRWDRPDGEWLPAEQIHSDPLGDLNTVENKLSIWLVDDELNLDRIATALAANREDLDKIDCALIDEQILTAGGFSLKPSEGDTPDLVANKLWHRNVIELSGDGLVDLATVILENMTRKGYGREDIKGLIAQGLASKRIDYSKLKPKLKERFPQQ